MVEQVQELADAEMPVGVMKHPLSDEVRASLAAVQRAQEAARARVRRQTVRTRTWFGAIVGGVGLAVILLGPRVGRQFASPVAASPSRVASAPVVAARTPPPAVSAAESQVKASEPAGVAPSEVAAGSPASAGSVATPGETPAQSEASMPASRSKGVASDDIGGCRTTAGQPRWRVDVEACARIFESRPNDAALALTIAHGHHARGHMAQSGEWARRAIALDPRLAEAFVILARAEARAGRPDASAQAYRKYLELVPRGWHASEARAAVRRTAARAGG